MTGVLTVTISQLQDLKHPVWYSGLMVQSEYRVTYSRCSYSNNFTTATPKHPVCYSGLMAHSVYRVTYSRCSYSNNFTTAKPKTHCVL